MWLVCQLVAAIFPYDLDAVAENLPFSKYTLDNLLGRTHYPEEYRYYFERHPHSSLYIDDYHRLLTEHTNSRVIIPEQIQKYKEITAGYIDGVRYSASPHPGSTVFARLGVVPAAAACQEGQSSTTKVGRAGVSTATVDMNSSDNKADDDIVMVQATAVPTPVVAINIMPLSNP
jgi:hypothetical protein